MKLPINASLSNGDPVSFLSEMMLERRDECLDMERNGRFAERLVAKKMRALIDAAELIAASSHTFVAFVDIHSLEGRKDGSMNIWGMPISGHICNAAASAHLASVTQKNAEIKGVGTAKRMNISVCSVQNLGHLLERFRRPKPMPGTAAKLRLCA